MVENTGNDPVTSRTVSSQVCNVRSTFRFPRYKLLRHIAQDYCRMSDFMVTRMSDSKGHRLYITVRLSITLLSSHFKFYRLETFPVYIPIVFIFFSKSVVFLYRTITWSGDLPCDVVFCVPTIVLGQNDARNVDVSCHKHFVDLTGDQKNAAYCYQR